MAYPAAPIWPAASVAPPAYRETLARLRDYEGWTCLWRPVLGAIPSEPAVRVSSCERELCGYRKRRGQAVRLGPSAGPTY